MTIAEQIVEISRLKAGWLDGEGLVVSNLTLMRAIQEASAVEARTGHTPYLYPRENGGVSIEWDVAGGGHILVEPIAPLITKETLSTILGEHDD